jgi:hypothetical protein
VIGGDARYQPTSASAAAWRKTRTEYSQRALDFHLENPLATYSAMVINVSNRRAISFGDGLISGITSRAAAWTLCAKTCRNIGVPLFPICGVTEVVDGQAQTAGGFVL